MVAGEQRIDLCASVAAPSSAVDSAACMVARKTRTGGGAYVFVHSESADDWKAKRRAGRQDPPGANAIILGILRSCARASATRKEPYSNRGERNRHYARAGCLRLDADQRFYNRRPGSDAC